MSDTIEVIQDDECPSCKGDKTMRCPLARPDHPAGDAWVCTVCGTEWDMTELRNSPDLAEKLRGS